MYKNIDHAWNLVEFGNEEYAWDGQSFLIKGQIRMLNFIAGRTN
jgi:hypothetical protein